MLGNGLWACLPNSCVAEAALGRVATWFGCTLCILLVLRDTRAVARNAPAVEGAAAVKTRKGVATTLASMCRYFGLEKTKKEAVFKYDVQGGNYRVPDRLSCSSRGSHLFKGLAAVIANKPRLRGIKHIWN